MMMMQRYLLLLLGAAPAVAWLPSCRSPVHRLLLVRYAGNSLDPNSNHNPCWEDLYDDDCVMENAAAARFVAADWIKSMPCGQGMQDCDFPEDLKAPETRPEAGIDHVDVMDMLGLKRAKAVDSQ